MREIKFRAWDKKTGQWVYFDLIDTSGRSNFTLTEWAEMPKCQFTGLLDNNGNEIFEGDLLKIPEDNVIGMVVYEEEMAGFFAQIKSFDETLSARIDHTEIRMIEIMGNIYENPDLIK